MLFEERKEKKKKLSFVTNRRSKKIVYFKRSSKYHHTSLREVSKHKSSKINVHVNYRSKKKEKRKKEKKRRRREHRRTVLIIKQSHYRGIYFFFSPFSSNAIRSQIDTRSRGLLIRVHVLEYYDNKQWVTVDQPSITHAHCEATTAMQESRQRRKKKKKNDVVQLGERRSFLSMMDNRIAFDVLDGEKIIRNALNRKSRKEIYCNFLIVQL